MNKPQYNRQSPARQEGSQETPPDNGPCPNKERHDHLSRDIRITGLVLLVYSVFCFVTLSQVDEIIITRNVEIPLADYQIKFSSFLAVGPLALVIITFYLHLFIWEWERIKSVAPERKLPFTFNMENLPAQILTGLLFYILPPAVLLFFSYRAHVWSINMDNYWGMAALLAFIVLGLIFFIHTQKYRSKTRFYERLSLTARRTIVIGFALAGCVLSAMSISGYLNKLFPLDLVQTDLSNQKISRVNLNNANLFAANIKGTVFLRTSLIGANLEGADLEGADLRKTNLMQANLKGANLKDANLERANLKLANLKRANLEGANLSMARLKDADLKKANLKGAIIFGRTLVGAINLSCEQIKSANVLKDDIISSKINIIQLPKYLEVIWDEDGSIKECYQ